MPTPFGPQLIGETEKTLNALLRHALEPSGLSEPQWVTLRVAAQLEPEGNVDARVLARAVADRAHFEDAAELVDELTARDLLEDGRISGAGSELIGAVQATIATEVRSIFGDLPEADVASTERVLNEVLDRARQVLAGRD